MEAEVADLEEIRERQENDLIAMHAKLDRIPPAAEALMAEWHVNSQYPEFVLVALKDFKALRDAIERDGEG